MLAIIIINFIVQIIKLRLREVNLCKILGDVAGICTEHCLIPQTHALSIIIHYVLSILDPSNK